jgi:hypothetical protein
MGDRALIKGYDGGQGMDQEVGSVTFYAGGGWVGGWGGGGTTT